MEKYYREDNSNMRRSSKNVRLYREVYNDYDNLDNLPIPDNTNEIDRTELEKMVKGTVEDSKIKREDKYLYQEEQIVKEKQVPTNKIYDINMLLENAKKENEKLKENDSLGSDSTSNYRLLSTLENKILTKGDIELYQNKYDSNYEGEEQGELKYQTKRISVDPNIDQIITHDTTSSLSLDILSDLKSSDDSNVVSSFDKGSIDNDSCDSGLDIVKPSMLSDDSVVERTNDSAFYTDTYSFSNKDFDDDFYDDSSSGHYGVKIFLLVLFIIVCGAVMFYFISNYGIN